jgi:hypothetical protein
MGPVGHLEMLRRWNVLERLLHQQFHPNQVDVRLGNFIIPYNSTASVKETTVF